jgi:hypothetical protein
LGKKHKKDHKAKSKKDKKSAKGAKGWLVDIWLVHNLRGVPNAGHETVSTSKKGKHATLKLVFLSFATVTTFVTGTPFGGHSLTINNVDVHSHSEEHRKAHHQRKHPNDRPGGGRPNPKQPIIRITISM